MLYNIINHTYKHPALFLPFSTNLMTRYRVHGKRHKARRDFKLSSISLSHVSLSPPTCIPLKSSYKGWYFDSGGGFDLKQGLKVTCLADTRCGAGREDIRPVISESKSTTLFSFVKEMDKKVHIFPFSGDVDGDFSFFSLTSFLSFILIF